MSRFPRIRRRPDHWRSAHERARARAAERLDGPLGLTESAWLDEHLATCPDCAAVAAGYEADRLTLRSIREPMPQPPRDLWARTAARIEQESIALGRTPRPGRASRGLRMPVGLLSGVAVVAVVVGVSAMSGVWAPFPHGTIQGEDTPPASIALDTAGGASAEAALVPPTPFAVDAGDVAYVRNGADGRSTYRETAIEAVCPAGGPDGCPLIEDIEGGPLTIETAPRSIIGSPTGDQAVAVSGDPDGGEQVVVLRLPDKPSAGGGASDEPSTVPATEPPASPTPDPLGTEAPGSDAPPTDEPGSSASPSDEPVESAETPTDAPSPTPTESATPTAKPSATPLPTPTQTAAASLAIASGVEVVGESAAFSPNGRWFAFSARPSGGDGGPDIYVWRVGDEKARKLTDDGTTVFGGWAGERVVGSRPSESGDGAVEPVSVVLDPSSGRERDSVSGIWRPVVDRARERAVAWSGTVRPTADGTVWLPADGRLELLPWGSALGDAGGDAQVVTDGPVAVYDVRWDETGEWFGAWIQEHEDADSGRLSLYHVDPASGELSRPDGAPTDEPARAGFSIGDGRLAWATPPGHDGEGSRIQIVAWRDGSVGTVETVPGEDVVVIR